MTELEKAVREKFRTVLNKQVLTDADKSTLEYATQAILALIQDEVRKAKEDFARELLEKWEIAISDMGAEWLENDIKEVLAQLEKGKE